jgi:thioredoxin reductase (NADPH)
MTFVRATFPDECHLSGCRIRSICLLILSTAFFLSVSIGRLEGEDGVLEAVRWRHGASGKEVRRPIRHLFLFIGAEPNTDWLSGSGVALDAKGFVLTGGDGAGSRRPLETSRRGVFAIGDVRSSSVKRVAAAVGEGGAQVVATLHAFLVAADQEPAFKANA